MERDYEKMTEQEALDILRKEWQDYEKQTEQNRKDGMSMVQWLSVLESFA